MAGPAAATREVGSDDWRFDSAPGALRLPGLPCVVAQGATYTTAVRAGTVKRAFAGS